MIRLADFQPIRRKWWYLGDNTDFHDPVKVVIRLVYSPKVFKFMNDFFHSITNKDCTDYLHRQFHLKANDSMVCTYRFFVTDDYITSYTIVHFVRVSIFRRLLLRLLSFLYYFQR